MLILESTALLAPQAALCASCGCSCAGDIVIRTMEPDALFAHPVATYRHASAGGCLVARARSETRWDGVPDEERKV